MHLRTLLAAILGVVLGALLVAYPEAVVRAHLFGRVPGGRGSEYGADAAVSGRRRRLVQLIGVGMVLAGLYFTTVVFGFTGRHSL